MSNFQTVNFLRLKYCSPALTLQTAHIKTQQLP